MGIVALLIGATTVFAQMHAIVLTIGFILLVSLLITVAVRAIVRYAEGWIPFPTLVLTGTELLLSLAVVTLLFAVIFKILPDVRIAWGDVWLGAAITAVLFTMGRYLIAMYLAYTAPESPYGAAGSLVLLLMWVYYLSLILLFGAALTNARTLTSHTVGTHATAVRVKAKAVEE